MANSIAQVLPQNSLLRVFVNHKDNQPETNEVRQPE